MSDLEPRHQEMIESILERPLTQAELQPVNASQGLSAEQREVVAFVQGLKKDIVE